MKNIEDKTLREFIDDVIRYYAKNSQTWFTNGDVGFHGYTRWLMLKDNIMADKLWENMTLSELLPPETEYENSLMDTVFSQIGKHTCVVRFKPSTLKKIKKQMLLENKSISQIIEEWSENYD